MPPGEEKHVGLLVEPLHGLGGRIMDGVARWVRSNPGWTVAIFDGEPGELARLARRWEGDGMVCTLPSEQMQEAANSRNFPVVNVGGQILNHNTVSVVNDHPACARLTLDHFQDRGFARFCFIGNNSDSDDLGTAFLNLCQEQSITPTSFEATLGEEATRRLALRSSVSAGHSRQLGPPGRQRARSVSPRRNCRSGGYGGARSREPYPTLRALYSSPLQHRL